MTTLIAAQDEITSRSASALLRVREKPEQQSATVSIHRPAEMTAQRG